MIMVNNDIYFDDLVIDDMDIEFTAPLRDSNHLVIRHYDKRFGDDGQWDTVTHDNVIIQDRAIRLQSIELDNVNVKEWVIANCQFETENNGSIMTDYFGFNGQITISFGSPVYDWIIQTIVKSKSRKLLDLAQPIETSFDNLFDYTQDLLELDEIDSLLRKHANLFGKSP